MTHLSLLIGLYGVFAVVTVVCVYFLPETSQGEIPDTIEEAIQLCSKKKKRTIKRNGVESGLTDTIKT